MRETPWVDVLRRQRDQWRRFMTPIQARRAGQLWGLSEPSPESLEAAWIEGVSLPIQLEPDDAHAVMDLETALYRGTLPAALRALHRARAWGVAVKDASGWHLHPEGWIAWASRVDASDAAWWCRRLSSNSEAARYTARLALETPAGGGCRADALPPGYLRFRRAEQAAEDERLEAGAGQRLRAALWACLQSTLPTDPPVALRWMLDHPPMENDPGWTVLRLGELFADDDALVRRVTRATESTEGTALALLDPAQGLDASVEPLTPDALLKCASALAVAPRLDPVDALTSGLADHASIPSWRFVLGLAQAPGVIPALEALLLDAHWWDFDAPGEGELPRLWSRVLVLAGGWTTSLGAALVDLAHATGNDPEPWWTLSSPSLFDVLEPLPSPHAAGEMHTEALSALSSYHHGLQDGTQEAYGDVHAPWDPFSQRPSPMDEAARMASESARPEVQDEAED